MSERETVFITGASRGIGAETARLFAERGYAVGINYCRSRDRAEALAEELRGLGAQVGLYPGDVSDRAQVDGMMQAFLRDFGRIEDGSAGGELHGQLRPLLRPWANRRLSRESRRNCC